MNTDVLQSPNLTLSANSNATLNYRRDAHNYITQLFGEQLPAVATGFFNVHMTKDIVIQPHWHTNVTEMILVISGEAMTSVFNPFSRQLMTSRLRPGEVSVFPKGWFHWIEALSEHVHLLAIFDRPTPDIVLGSDFLSQLPDIVRQAYCIDPQAYAAAVAPARDAAILGPAVNCGAAGGGDGAWSANPGQGDVQAYLHSRDGAGARRLRPDSSACPALRPFGDAFAYMYADDALATGWTPKEWALGYGG